MDEITVVQVLGGGFAVAATLGALRRAGSSRAHRDAKNYVAWLLTSVVLGLVAASLVLVPETWVDGYGAVLDVFGGG